MSYEEPRYAVRLRSGSVEYRQYEPYLVAETLVQDASHFDGAGNEGFRRLFRYIAGGNTSRARIAMTAPVSQAAQGEKIAMTVPVHQSGSAAGWRVAFLLPRQYTLETAPVPNDPRVQVVPVAGIRPAGEPQLARYNAPYTLPFLRRNEVSVSVDRMPHA